MAERKFTLELKSMLLWARRRYEQRQLQAQCEPTSRCSYFGRDPDCRCVVGACLPPDLRPFFVSGEQRRMYANVSRVSDLFAGTQLSRKIPMGEGYDRVEFDFADQDTLDAASYLQRRHDRWSAQASYEANVNSVWDGPSALALEAKFVEALASYERRHLTPEDIAQFQQENPL